MFAPMTTGMASGTVIWPALASMEMVEINVDEDCTITAERMPMERPVAGLDSNRKSLPASQLPRHLHAVPNSSKLGNAGAWFPPIAAHLWHAARARTPFSRTVHAAPMPTRSCSWALEAWRRWLNQLRMHNATKRMHYATRRMP